jgi:CHASE1-domain containing sensor protein
MSSTAAPTALAWYRRTDWLLLLAGLLASLGLWWYLGYLAQGLAQGRFERQARAAADLLQQRVKSKNDLLLGMRGVLLVKPQLSRSEFERVAASLQLDVDQLRGTSKNRRFQSMPTDADCGFQFCLFFQQIGRVSGRFPPHFSRIGPLQAQLGL